MRIVICFMRRNNTKKTQSIQVKKDVLYRFIPFQTSKNHGFLNILWTRNNTLLPHRTKTYLKSSVRCTLPLLS